MHVSNKMFCKKHKILCMHAPNKNIFREHELLMQISQMIYSVCKYILSMPASNKLFCKKHKLLMHVS